ncbi:PadR family transcriptional regulator [Haploplasma axanthum]|uniref:Lineage-specific thermal regulator protein n=1 Tax=Haploplasma axanthum TaxID=29552 RepID=A0A449BF23_HAPAX|nr:PadR family transcriptional regulator [Haploplasma axanthum]VEU81036.1 lineage-specific thermal regulator protein [Haploplasma axanthum]
MDTVLENLILELNRGTQVLTVLNILRDEQYGYALLQKLNDNDISIEAGTLYPLLRRLEKQNLLVSSWDKLEPRPRKYYKISNYGEEVLKKLKTEWSKIVKSMMNVLEV